MSLQYLQVFPPVFALQLSGLLFKLAGSLLESVGSVVQLGELLVPFQHLFDVCAHDADHLVDLDSDRTQRSVVDGHSGTAVDSNLGLGLLELLRGSRMLRSDGHGVTD